MPCLDVIMIAFFLFSIRNMVFQCIFLGKKAIIITTFGRGVRGVQASASASVERRAAKPREARNEGGGLPLQSRAFSHAHDHLRVSHVLLEGLRKKRDCS